MKSENEKSGLGLANLANLANYTLERARQPSQPSTPEAIAEHLAERAAIMEYDGGLPREQAEAEARRSTARLPLQAARECRRRNLHYIRRPGSRTRALLKRYGDQAGTGGKGMSDDNDFTRLCDAIRQQPRPPCDGCLWSRECTVPERCGAFRFYVETGREIQPPREFPGERCGG